MGQGSLHFWRVMFLSPSKMEVFRGTANLLPAWRGVDKGERRVRQGQRRGRAAFLFTERLQRRDEAFPGGSFEGKVGGL